MNRRTCTFLLIILLLAWAPAAAETAEELPLALGGLDPVRLIEGREVQGHEGLTETDERYTYRFASAATRARFRRDPARYGIQGDGSCPVAPSATAQPDIFTVHEGRIYAFATKGCIPTFQDDPEFFLNPTEYEARDVAILLFDGVELLDFAGPGEVFAAAAHGRAFNVYTVGASDASVVSQGFVAVTPEYTIENSPVPDVLVIPGGGVHRLIRDEKMMEWIKGTAEKAITLSVCNGAFVLARAGLLDGLEATTHHGSIDSLREAAGKTVVHADRRWVDNGRVITSAGVSSGIEASLHLVSRLLGEKRATAVARYMEYDWTPEAQSRGLVRRAAQD